MDVLDIYDKYRNFTGKKIIKKERNTLKDNEYYVLGDNRISSSDSRIWGCVKNDQILGKVIFKYWPLDSFGVAR